MYVLTWVNCCCGRCVRKQKVGTVGLNEFLWCWFHISAFCWPIFLKGDNKLKERRNQYTITRQGSTGDFGTEFNRHAPPQVQFQTGPGLVTIVIGAKQGLLNLPTRARNKAIHYT